MTETSAADVLQTLVAAQQVRDWGAGNKIAATAASLFPDAADLIRASAIFSMHAEQWEQALRLWKHLDGLEAKPRPGGDIDRRARCAEIGNDWDYQQRIPGLSKTRGVFGRGMMAFSDNDWVGALECFKKLPNLPKPKLWPFGVSYWRKTAELNLRLQDIDADLQREFLSRFIGWKKAIYFYAEDMCGIDLLLRKTSPALSRSFWRAYRRFVAIGARYDYNLQDCASRALAGAVGPLANELMAAKLPWHALPPRAWLLMSNVMLLGCEYSAYHRCRSMALEASDAPRSVLVKNVEVDAFRWDMRVAAETENLAAMAAFFEHRNFYEMKLGLKNMSIADNAALYFGRPDKLLASSRQSYGADDKKFASFINGKSIAVVGPADVHLLNGEEIDQFDVVLRFNYKGLAGRDPVSFGTKTDCSYYISSSLKDMGESLAEKMRELSAIVCDGGKDRELIRSFVSGRLVRARHPIGNDFTNPFFKGTANGVPRSLMDILRFAPARVKVFNSNMWIDGSGHRPGSTIRDVNFVRHDPIGNFLCMKRFVQHGLIEADTYLEQILSMTVAEYCEALGRQFRPSLETL